MPTTTNYGWTTPADTDLVKDGASAIRTLGNGVDTTTKNLNPQTTLGDLAYRSATSNVNTRLPIGSAGQVLTVASGVPSWATPTDQTPLTTKGDLFTFSTVDARLGVGADGTVLTADSAEATGLKWATPASGSTYVGASATKSAGQTIATASWVAVTWDTEQFDTDTIHSTATNTSRFTVPAGKAGKYLVSGSISWTGSTSGTIRLVAIYKNGVEQNQVTAFAPTADGCIQPFAHVYNLAVADYIEIYVRHNVGSNTDVQGGSAQSRVEVSLLGA